MDLLPYFNAPAAERCGKLGAFVVIEAVTATDGMAANAKYLARNYSFHRMTGSSLSLGGLQDE